VGWATPLTANADFTLKLSVDGVADQVFTDTDHDGQISVLDFSVGDFLLSGNWASSNAGSGSVPATLALTQLSVRNNASGFRTVTITIEDTGFMVPIGAVQVDTHLSALGSFNTGENVSMVSYVNGGQVGDTLSLSHNSDGISASDVTTIGVSPYSIKSVTTLTLGSFGVLMSGGSTEVSPEVSPTPAPATAIAALAGAPILGAFGWLRRRKARQALTA
jgi:hypothetical protein